MTKKYLEEITQAVKLQSKPVNPSVILSELGWDKETKKEVFSMFGAETFVPILEKIENIEIVKNDKGTAYVSLRNETRSIQNKRQNTSFATQNRLKKLLKLLNSGLYEREEAVRLALLSAISGESIFYLGPPGTAKSMISSRIHKSFKEGTKYFEYLMNEFSTPDEIFGSIKLKGLDDGIYEKNTSGYLPEAEVAFLDEIWKSGPAILNTLLTIINERKFKNGDKTLKVPLQILLAASNELPKENAGLEALYDRFTIRTLVNPVSFENHEDFFNLCEESGDELVVPEELKPSLISVDEIKDWQSKISKISLDDNIKEVIIEIRREMERKNSLNKRDKNEMFYVSDRRWKKIIHLLKTSAFLCDRDAIDLMDCQLISYCIWNTPKQRGEVQKIVQDIVQLHGLEYTTDIEDIQEQIKEFEEYVNETFFDFTPASNKPISYKMKDGHTAYKIQSPKEIQSYNICIPYYICVDRVWDGNDDNTGAYYDKDLNVIGDYDYAINDEDYEIIGNSIKWKDCNKKKEYSSIINTRTIQQKWTLKESLFKNKNILKPVIDNSNLEHYKIIADTIEKEIKHLQDFRAKIEQPFNENLFADPLFKEVITLKIEEEKKKLEDAKVELDKQKCRYEEK